MSNLYTLTNEFLQIKNQLEDLDLDPQLFTDTLEGYKVPIEEKVENIVKYVKSLEALAEAKKAEAKRLSESAGKDLNKVEWLKQYIADNLNAAGIKSLQAGVFTLAFRKGSEVVEVDETKLPEWAFIPQEPKPMGKADLKKIIQAGKEIPGVSLVRKPDSLVVK